MSAPAEHVWDDEAVEMVTYTPPEEYDAPWVIRMCLGHDRDGRYRNCGALLIDKNNGAGPMVYIPESPTGRGVPNG